MPAKITLQPGQPMSNTSITFKVTQIGCGLAGYKPEDIAPMFEGSPKNCWFDHAWYQWLGADYHYWGSL